MQRQFSSRSSVLITRCPSQDDKRVSVGAAFTAIIITKPLVVGKQMQLYSNNQVEFSSVVAHNIGRFPPLISSSIQLKSRDRNPIFTNTLPVDCLSVQASSRKSLKNDLKCARQTSEIKDDCFPFKHTMCVKITGSHLVL